MIHYTSCPVCGSQAIHLQLTARDHTVSQKEFPIWHCNSCTARFTQDVPEAEAIGEYYASEDYVSHSDTRKGLINSLYHLVRKQTLQSKRRLIINETGKLKGKILDIGCGTGAFLHHMAAADWAVTGLEPDKKAREKAAALYQLEPLDPGNLYTLHPASFDAITMWHVLEHVHDLHGYLERLSLLLAPGGKIFIAVPNYSSRDAVIYGKFWAAYDVPRHLYHFTPRSMEQLLGSYRLTAGEQRLKLLGCKPMWFDSYYVSMLSEKYKNGRGNILRAAWNGLLSNRFAGRDRKKCSSVIYVIGR